VFSIENNKTFSRASALFWYLLDSDRSLSDFRFGDHRLKQIRPVAHETSEKTKLVITAHIYYEEFLLDFMKQLPIINKLGLILVTTPNGNFKRVLDKEFVKSGIRGRVIKSANRGRNFGPLFTELADEILRHDFLIHVHSKRSAHASTGVGEDWASRNMNFLLHPKKIVQMLEAFGQDNNVGIIYPDCFDLIRKINFRWGASIRPTKKFFKDKPGFEQVRWKGRIDFPAGGMFAARVSAIREMLELDWAYEDFPKECGQLDGTLQHGVERMLGALVTSKGLDQLVYSGQRNEFLLIPRDLEN
jgi:lipopolysaccharide biosynthesis protein